MDHTSVSKPLLMAITAVFLALSALPSHAQWQWIDKDGRKVFSDRSPPAEISDRSILRRPAGSVRQTQQLDAAGSVPVAVTSTAVKPAAAASAPAPGASAPKLSGKDAELEAKKKQAEAQEIAKKKAEDEKVAKARADNCERAKTGLATLKSGVRMSSMNAKGEQEVYDDAKRASETKRIQEIISSDCK